MRHGHLIEAARAAGLSRAEAAVAVRAVFEAIVEGLAQGEGVMIRGFGRFYWRATFFADGRRTYRVGFKPDKQLGTLGATSHIDYGRVRGKRVRKGEALPPAHLREQVLARFKEVFSGNFHRTG